jgi:xanthine/uracil/vitamin C permease (AzgA family)
MAVIKKPLQNGFLCGKNREEIGVTKQEKTKMLTGLVGFIAMLVLYLVSDSIFDKMKILKGEENEKRREHLATSFVIAGAIGLLVAGHWAAGIILVITVAVLQVLNQWFDENFMQEEGEE